MLMLQTRLWPGKGSCDCFLVASKNELYNRIFWHSDPCHIFLRKKTSVPASAGVWCGTFNLRRESELQRSPKNRAEGLLPLLSATAQDPGGFTVKSVLTLAKTGATTFFIPKES